MTDDRRYLLSLISQGEHQQQDFKYKVQDARKLARSVSAFANTDGGRLLIGVRDDGHLSGVRSEEEIYMMHQAALKYCQPAASIKFDTYHCTPDRNDLADSARSRMRTIVVATIPRSERRPVCALGDDERPRAYVRINDENIIASPVHLQMWRDEAALRGTMLTYTDTESHFIQVLGLQSRQTLNQLVRRSRLPRPRVITLLARFIRYGIALCEYVDQCFLFSVRG